MKTSTSLIAVPILALTLLGCAQPAEDRVSEACDRVDGALYGIDFQGSAQSFTDSVNQLIDAAEQYDDLFPETPALAAEMRDSYVETGNFREQQRVIIHEISAVCPLSE